jgi:predicted O-methyltransferase YrrM
MMDSRHELLTYIRSLVSYDNPLLEHLDEDAKHRDDIQPFIEKEGARLLSLLVRLLKPREALELGMGIAYSTIWLAGALRDSGGSLVTVDNHPRTVHEARGHLEQSGLLSYVDILFGDAQVILPQLIDQARNFDLIFQDCGKSVYNEVYEHVYTLLAPGGLLISDDTLLHFDPKVRRGLGNHVSVYNQRLFSDDRYYSVLLPVGQGIALSMKR